MGPVRTQEVFVPGLTVRAWPNPVSNGPLNLQIDGWSSGKPLRLHLRDNHGRLVRQQQLSVISNSHQLDMSDLPSGLYFYELYGQQLLASGKVVVLP